MIPLVPADFKKVMKDFKDDTELLVQTFRSHHNAYTEGDGSGAKIIRYPEQLGWFYYWTQLIIGIFLIHYFLWFIPMSIVLYIPVHFGYWYISVIMLGFYMKSFFNKDELKKGRPWDAVRTNLVWRLMQNYVKFEVVREAKLDPNRQYIFGLHPHGIIILSRLANYGNLFETFFPRIEARVLAATPMFMLPGSRELCLWLGAVRADKSNAVKMLQKHKYSLYLYPGGSAEIFETDSESRDTVIIARKGFIKLALQNGCDLVPSFVFGEKHAYHKLDIPQKVKSFMMDTFRTPLIIFWGRLYTWLPLVQDKFFLSVVYGKPIRIEKAIPEPSNEEVDALYERFYGDIRNLFDKYKTRYGYLDSERLIIREAHAEEKRRLIEDDHREISNGNGVHKGAKLN